MTRSLVGLAALIALPAWAQEPTAEALTPYEAVVERPLDSTGPVSPSSLGSPKASGQSAVAPAGGAPEMTAYGAAMANAQRTASAQPSTREEEPTPNAEVMAADVVEPRAASGGNVSPWAQAVAPKPAGVGVPMATKPSDPMPDQPAPPRLATQPAPVPVSMELVPSEAPVAAPAADLESLPPTSPVATARPFTAPGDGVDTPSGTSPVPVESNATADTTPSLDDERASRREQRTVFGPRRHTRFLGLYGGGSLGAPGLGGPSSGAVEVGVMVGGALRLGAEFRGLSYGRSGPDVRLASSGLVVGWAFKTRSMVHPTADVVLGGGLVSHQNGDIIGGVGVTAVRGGLELNLMRSVRLTASVGWRGIAAPSRDVRRDLNGLEGLVGVRVGWF